MILRQIIYQLVGFLLNIVHIYVVNILQLLVWTLSVDEVLSCGQLNDCSSLYISGILKSSVIRKMKIGTLLDLLMFASFRGRIKIISVSSKSHLDVFLQGS